MPASPVLTYEEYKCSEGLPAGYFETKQRTLIHTGLTKREMFAMHIIGHLANGTAGYDEQVLYKTKVAVKYADALLSELDK